MTGHGSAALRAGTRARLLAPSAGARGAEMVGAADARDIPERLQCSMECARRLSPPRGRSGLLASKLISATVVTLRAYVQMMSASSLLRAPSAGPREARPQRPPTPASRRLRAADMHRSGPQPT